MTRKTTPHRTRMLLARTAVSAGLLFAAGCAEPGVERGAQAEPPARQASATTPRATTVAASTARPATAAAPESPDAVSRERQLDAQVGNSKAATYMEPTPEEALLDAEAQPE